MLVVFLVFSSYSPNCDVDFKITNKLKVNNDNFKFNSNFKSHITVRRTLKKQLTFKEMLVVLLVFSSCSPNCNVAFKITNRLKVNNDNFKFNGDFKSHIIVRRTLKEQLAFPKSRKYIRPSNWMKNTKRRLFLVLS
jgi:hypothetical protein